MLCKNFDELSYLLSEDGCGTLNRAELFARFSEISANVLLSGEDIEYLLLHFVDCQICLCACGDTDEIQFTPIPTWDAADVRDISSSSPWNRVIGQELFRAWRLINDGGYDDGLQFSFGHEAIRLQVEAIASRINFNLLTQCPDNIASFQR